MKRVHKEFMYTVGKRGLLTTVTQINPCCSVMAENITRHKIHLPEDYKNSPSISFIEDTGGSNLLYKFSFCPWCGAKIERIFKELVTIGN